MGQKQRLGSAVGVTLVHVRLICILKAFEAMGATMAMDGSSMKLITEGAASSKS